MDTTTCDQCGKLITSKPCPYCGGKTVTHEVNVSDGIKFSDKVGGVVISGPSEVTIKKGKEAHTYSFAPGTLSDQIVRYSLSQATLCGTTPDYIKDQLVQDINNIERVIEEPTEQHETTQEHSFELNLGIFKYTYKRTTKA
jgi:hypothetical protein